MKTSKQKLSPTELARLAKRDELRSKGRVSTCDFYGSPLKVKPDWAT
jgi:hypothetical protein